MSGPQVPSQRLRRALWRRLVLLVVLTAVSSGGAFHHGAVASADSRSPAPAVMATTGAGHSTSGTGHHGEHPAGAVIGAPVARAVRTAARQAPLRARAQSVLLRLLEAMVARRGPPTVRPRRQRRAAGAPALEQLCVCRV